MTRTRVSKAVKSEPTKLKTQRRLKKINGRVNKNSRKEVKVEAKAIKSEFKQIGSPFPSFSRPTEQECRNVNKILQKLHGNIDEDWKIHGGDLKDVKSRESVLDALVRTILSQNTTDTTSHKAFASLKAKFPTWESVRKGNPQKVAESIKVGGLSEIKTARIQTILNSIHLERKECSLEHLRSKSDDEIKGYLSKFKGVGPKTISCVLMFCLERPEFPVDVHVWKIAISLGWVPAKASREQTYDHLNSKVPDDIKYSLHVLLVEHGKVYNNDIKLLRPGIKVKEEVKKEF